MTLKATQALGPIHAILGGKICTTSPSGAERLMREQSQSSDLLVNIWFKRRWKKMFRASGSVFCLVIIELHRRHNLDDAQRVVAHDRTGQFLAGDVALAQQALAIRPIVAAPLLGRGGKGFGSHENPRPRAPRPRAVYRKRRPRRRPGRRPAPAPQPPPPPSPRRLPPP